MMNRESAIELLKKYVKTKNLIKHCIAVGACMRELAEVFGEDLDEWELAGILHDIDYEITKNDFSKHGLEGAKILKEHGFSQKIIDSVKRHPGHESNPPQTKMDWALYSSDPLTGLIVASTLMHPTKKIENVDTRFVLKRFKEKRFAAGASREQIKKCSELGLELEEFVEICLKAMQKVKDELGL